MGDFPVKEMARKEGVWASVSENLVFIDNYERFFHLPDDYKVSHYYVENLSKEIYYFYNNRKFETLKKAVKDATQKLTSKPENYKYGVYAKVVDIELLPPKCCAF